MQTELPLATGDCYEASLNYIQQLALEGRDMTKFFLIHAEVLGNAGDMEGIQFGHAWVEEDRMIPVSFLLQEKLLAVRYAHDRANGKEVCIPAKIYRGLGNVEKIGNIHEYTYEKALDTAMAFGTYGPWDLQTCTGL